MYLYEINSMSCLNIKHATCYAIVVHFNQFFILPFVAPSALSDAFASMED